ncbi:hypothetical protein [Sphingomonas sp. MM-1]|uniref:hypothetical protein n=1 Tax=Sphingomonas sp. MM-1 TaxID=745310 RepID=UPI000A5BB2F2|nr:hypothetical protein [Sphingomonas sp. MM-1]
MRKAIRIAAIAALLMLPQAAMAQSVTANLGEGSISGRAIQLDTSKNRLISA